MSTKQERRTNVVRCAVYTRKSSEEGLHMEFNSLDAQRESAEAYIASMKHEGWVCLPEKYDDGGFTGGNMERPALKRLMSDIEMGRIDCVVVYKVDRLSRSLLDFARLMELFERKKISFVSVTQQFNTTQSMGRLTLNVLLSFAQFEREIIGERTRDKIAAARRKGKWSGGRSILGYDVDANTRKLVVNEAEAAIVQEIFETYLGGRSLLDIAKDLNSRAIRTKAVQTKKGTTYGGREWDKSGVAVLLRNVLYAGRVKHNTESFPGEHAAIVPEDLWGKVQARMKANARMGGPAGRHKYGAVLRGLLHCAPCGLAMGHTTAVKSQTRIYRYYTCYNAQKKGWESCPCKALPAMEIENFVLEQIKKIGKDPVVLAMTLAKCRERDEQRRTAAESELSVLERELKGLHLDLTRASLESSEPASPDSVVGARLADLHEKVEKASQRAEALRREIAELASGELTKAQVDGELQDFEKVWESLTPREQAALLHVLVQRVEYDAEKGSVSIRFHPLGLRTMKSTEKAA